MAAVTTLENDLSAAGEKFTFLQDMRAYIADLCDMLQVRHHGPAHQGSQSSHCTLHLAANAHPGTFVAKPNEDPHTRLP